MSALTNTRGNAILDAELLSTDKVRLLTALGSVSAAGTQVTGGSYAAQASGAWNSASAQAKSNSADIVFSGMPVCTVVGVEVWDSTQATRKWWGAVTTQRTFAAGDTCTISAGQLIAEFV